MDDTTFTGPVISADAAKRFQGLYQDNLPYVVSKAPAADAGLSKLYVSPIVLSGLDDENDLSYMDSGLPVLVVKVVPSLDAAFEEIQDTECGLSAGIFAKDPKVIARFNEEVDVPLRYVNQASRSLPAAHWASLAGFSQ